MIQAELSYSGVGRGGGAAGLVPPKFILPDAGAKFLCNKQCTRRLRVDDES